MTPEFTRKLSDNELIALYATDHAKWERYIDWLFWINGPLTERWGLREYADRRDLDAERENDTAGRAS